MAGPAPGGSRSGGPAAAAAQTCRLKSDHDMTSELGRRGPVAEPPQGQRAWVGDSRANTRSVRSVLICCVSRVSAKALPGSDVRDYQQTRLDPGGKGPPFQRLRKQTQPVSAMHTSRSSSQTPPRREEGAVQQRMEGSRQVRRDFRRAAAPSESQCATVPLNGRRLASSVMHRCWPTRSGD